MPSPDPLPFTPLETAALLPDRFRRWFASRGWSPREHQLALLAKARDDRSALLIAPTGAGKTLAGFLPTLVELSASAASKGGGEKNLVSTGRGVKRTGGLHTLYISPLKALAVDIARNLETPIAEMGLPIKVETRTGDTPVSRRQRQRRYPPDILLTTPEQLALLLSSDDAPFLFSSLKRIVLDELHALVTSKRGDLLSLGLARLWRLAPEMRAIGLSATVAEPESLARFLVPQREGKEMSADIVVAGGAAAPVVEMLDTKERLPWAGHTARHALGEMYDLIKRNKTTLIFVNTRSQAEMLFQDFWRMNDDGLAIALHHGSLDVAQRRKVEDAMAAGKLRGVVCTSSLDLGIDWGDIDLVINVGAPKGSSRLMQRIGRANHRLDEPSRAVLIPANRFEVLECRVAIDAIAENAQDTPPLRTGALDVLAQHVLGCACGEPFLSDELYAEVLTSAPYAALTRTDFDDVVDFVATGGYALKTYERFARIKQDKQGRWRVANPRVRQSYRLNVGTIVEEAMLKVRLVRSRGGGSGADRHDRPRRHGCSARSRNISSRGWSSATPLCSAARSCVTRRWSRIRSMSPAPTTRTPRCRPTWAASFRSRPISPNACGNCSTTGGSGMRCRSRCATGCRCNGTFHCVPAVRELLVETFPRGNKHYFVCYPFEGRLAHQTLGMLLTRRMERARVRPLGFVANEYALAVWGLGDMSFMIRHGKLDLAALFAPDMLGDDLEAWLAESALMKRTFRNCALISGLIPRRFTGEEKSRRQVLFSTDLIYDVLRKHQADHVLLRAARADAATGLLDLKRSG